MKPILSKMRIGTSSSCSSESVRWASAVPVGRFRDIPVHPTILRYIESIGVGIPPRRRQQKHSIVSSGRNSKTAWMPPAPFGPQGAYPVKVFASLALPKDVYTATKKSVPEIAIVGRSNVGKSTLLNALLYGNKNKDLNKKVRSRGKVSEAVKLPRGIKAVMSPRPGETKQITIYELFSRQDRDGTYVDYTLRLVDLPGYGFAYAKDEARENYHSLMIKYLLDRGKTLKRMLLLIDARHGMKTADEKFLMDLQKKGKKLPPIQVVLTKSDLVKQPDLARRVSQVRQQLSDCLVREAGNLPIMLVSAKAGVGYNNMVKDQARGGIFELQRELASLVVAKTKPLATTQDTKKNNLESNSI